MERKASAIIDLGLLSTSNCDTGMSFLYSGITPKIGAVQALDISLVDVISLCRRYLIASNISEEKVVTTNAIINIFCLFGVIGILGGDARSNISF